MLVPEQIEPVPPTVKPIAGNGFTVIVIQLLVAGDPIAHAKLVVMTQVITSP